MPRLFRSPRLAWLTLAAFLVAQPVVACAMLCLLDHHAAHEMARMSGSSAGDPIACHTGIETSTSHSPVQGLSPMVPAHEPALVQLAVLRTEVPEWRPAAAPEVSPSLDPPPPRIV